MLVSINILNIDEEEILETTAKERKAIKDSRRVFILETEKGFRSSHAYKLRKQTLRKNSKNKF